MEESPFVVLKFLPTNEDPDIYIDVGLRKWICTDLDDEMCGQTYWPSNLKSVTQLVKTEQSFKTEWPKLDVEIKRFYNTYPQAREAVSGFLADSNYETEIEQNMGRGKRKRKARQIESDSDTDSSVLSKITTKIIPAPPAMPFKKVSSEPQNCDNDSDASISSKLLKSSSIIKLNNKKPTRGRKEPSSKHSYAMDELKKVQTAKTIAASKMKRPESLASFKTKSPLKSSTSCNSLLINSPVNCDQNAVQEGMILSSNVQSLTQVPDCVFSNEDSTLTKDLTSTDHQPISMFNIDSVDTARCSSNTSNCNNTPELSSSSASHRRTLFKEQLHDKNTEKTLNTEMKVNRTLVTVEEIYGKVDILNMNVSKLMRAIIPSEKRISRLERMPALPLHTKQHLKEFETFLQADHNLAAACHYMSNHMKLSAKNPERKSATNMLTKLLSNTLAGEMNCDGGNGKIAFKTLKLYNLFQGTLQIAFPDSDLTEADTALAGWLKDAKWRKQLDGSLGNRNKENSQKNK
ncbi:uncharacterized protein LOC143895047 isoform X1 [Temnothorax americanus]|uniref:uncharacterized protein LOC143895047 isoform X1 n=3 Tax=Temnothorax americanus TaxID=1964332 RepID=UPI0040694BAE